MGFFSNLVDRIKHFFFNLKQERIQREVERQKREEERDRERRRIRDQQIREAEEKRTLYRIGNDFEYYVQQMFDPEKFRLVHRTPTNEETGGKYVRSMVYPDLRFREIATGQEFWVECKFRAHTEDKGEITWCSENQLHNYKRTRRESNVPVYIMMAVGGSPYNPLKVYVLNLDRINFTRLFYGTYKMNEIHFKKVDSFKQLDFIASLKQN